MLSLIGLVFYDFNFKVISFGSIFFESIFIYIFSKMFFVKKNIQTQLFYFFLIFLLSVLLLFKSKLDVYGIVLFISEIVVFLFIYMVLIYINSKLFFKNNFLYFSVILFFFIKVSFFFENNYYFFFQNLQLSNFNDLYYVYISFMQNNLLLLIGIFLFFISIFLINLFIFNSLIGVNLTNQVNFINKSQNIWDQYFTKPIFKFF